MINMKFKTKYLAPIAGILACLAASCSPNKAENSIECRTDSPRLIGTENGVEQFLGTNPKEIEDFAKKRYLDLYDIVNSKGVTIGAYAESRQYKASDILELLDTTNNLPSCWKAVKRKY